MMTILISSADWDIRKIFKHVLIHVPQEPLLMLKVFVFAVEDIICKQMYARNLSLAQQNQFGMLLTLHVCAILLENI